MLNIPFYKNSGDGMRCMQACIGSVAEYFFGEKFSLDELDKLTGRKEGKWTYTVQGVMALHDLGLRVKYYSLHNPQKYLQGEKYIRKTFGKDGDRVLKFTDLPVMQKAIRKILKENLFELKGLSLGEIKNKMEVDGEVAIILVNINKIYGRSDQYTGHFVVVTGIDKKYVYYHDSGPKNAGRNKKVTRKIFNKARQKETTKFSVIMVGD